MTETSGMQLDDDSLLSLFSKVRRFFELQILKFGGSKWQTLQSLISRQAVVRYEGNELKTQGHSVY